SRRRGTPERVPVDKAALLAARPAWMVVVDDGAGSGMGGEVFAQPARLRGAHGDAAGGVDRGEVPGSGIKAIRTGRRDGAEIRVVAGSGAGQITIGPKRLWLPAGVVLVVADRRSHARLERPPRQVEGRLVGGKPTALVLVVAQREDQVSSDQQVRRVPLTAGRGRPHAGV